MKDGAIDDCYMWWIKSSHVNMMWSCIMLVNVEKYWCGRELKIFFRGVTLEVCDYNICIYTPCIF